ncbi:hypothetical protein J6590_090235 [Homalodisca vitripennis]|nr:hypothetical protein J6590_090235 [Homalodisca vitripennis]
MENERLRFVKVGKSDFRKFSQKANIANALKFRNHATPKKCCFSQLLAGVPPPVEIHEEEFGALTLVVSSRKKEKPTMNQPLQSEQVGGGTSLSLG